MRSIMAASHREQRDASARSRTIIRAKSLQSSAPQEAQLAPGSIDETRRILTYDAMVLTMTVSA